MLNIIYNDDDIVVCIKPVGIISEEGGLPDMLACELGCEIYAVHRLDKPVGGLMVYAKNSKAAAMLSKQFSERTADKNYLCVIKGTPAEPTARLDDLLYKDKRTNKTFVVSRERKGVKKASLEYTLLGTVNSDEGNLSLLSVHLLTGRSHQIRVQFASRKLPLLGDARYGGKAKGTDVSLWSYRLAFNHPNTDKPLEFSQTPPDAYPWNLFEIS